MTQCPRCGGRTFKPYGFTPRGVGRSRCVECKRISLDPLKRRQVKVALDVPTNASAMDVALSLVRSGILTIEPDGAVLKRFDLDRWGHRKAIIPPRRADRIGHGGYLYVFCWFNGRQYGVLAHRLVFTHTFGAAPLRMRLSQPPLERWPFVHEGDEIDPLVVEINAAVPRGLYEQLRQEVCQEVAMAVLADGEGLTPDLVERCIKKSRRNYPIMHGYERSLDAPIRDGENWSRGIDRLSGDLNAPSPEAC